MRRTNTVTMILILCVVGFAGSVAAEIYRWTDSKGGEHFSMDLHRVPPENRAAAAQSAGSVGKGAKFNMIRNENARSPGRREGLPAALRGRARPASKTPVAVERIAGRSEESWRGKGVPPGWLRLR